MFGIYWQKDDPRKAEKIIKKLRRETDQDLLAKIALEAPLEEVRLAAVPLIGYRKALADVLWKSSSRPVREKAADCLAERSELAEVFLKTHTSDRTFDRILFEKTGEEAVCAWVRKDPWTMGKAAEFLDEDRLLRFVTEERGALPLHAREAALKNIKGRDRLTAVATMATDPERSPRVSDDDIGLIAGAMLKLDGKEAAAAIEAYRDEELSRRIAEAVSDQFVLEAFAESGNPAARKVAKEKLRKRAAVKAVVDDPSADIRQRLAAARRMAEEFSDTHPLLWLQQQGQKQVNGHILYRTAYSDWERVEYICLRCGKTGGQEDDSESTRHFGCRFSTERCRGYGG